VSPAVNDSRTHECASNKRMFSEMQGATRTIRVGTLVGRQHASDADRTRRKN
jgi:hypothetical protein